MEWDEATIAEEPPESVMTQFNEEVKKFWKKRENSTIAWSAHIMLDIANILTVIWMAAPGWGWTREVGGMDHLEGEYYGYWGVWYACWDLVEGDHRQSCMLATAMDQNWLPEYWVATQALSICVLVLGITAFVTWTVYMFNRSMSKKNTRIVLVFIGLVLTTAALNVAMFVTFAVEFIHHNRWICCSPEYEREVLEYHLWYAFVLSCISHGFYVGSGVAGVFEYVDLKKEQRLRVMYEAMEARRKNYPYSFEEASVDRFRPPYGYK